MELHLYLGGDGRIRPSRFRQLDGCGTEGLKVDITERYAPLGQRWHQGLHQGGWTTDIELVAPMGQCATQQIYVHMTFVLKVAPRQVGLAGTAVDNVQFERRMRRSDFLDQRLVGMFSAVAQPIVKVHKPFRLLGGAPAQHAHHRCDADAAADQHHGHIRIGVDEEMPGGGLDAQNISYLNVIVEVVG